MRVAIIFFGLTRNLKKTYLSIRKNVLESLRKQGIAFDVFLHTYRLATLTNMRSHEKNEILDNDEWMMLQPARFLVEDQDEVDKTLPHMEFCRYPNPWPEDTTMNSMKNMLRALHSQRQAWRLLDGADYDGYLVLRPDLEYFDPVVITRRVEDNTIYLPEWGKTRNGDNDRICLCDKKAAKVYLNRLDHLFGYADRHVPNSHNFLRHVLDLNGVNRKVLHVRAVRVRADKERLKRDSMENVVVYGHYLKCLKLYREPTPYRPAVGDDGEE